MSHPRPHRLSPSDREALDDIERALIALHQAFERLSSEGMRSLSGGYVPLANCTFSTYYERLDSAQ